MIKVLVCGVGGKMGQETAKAVLNDANLELVGGVDPKYNNQSLSNILEINDLKQKCYATLEEAFAAIEVDVVVDFTNPSVVFENVKTILSNAKHAVVGTTGLTAEQRDELGTIAKQKNVNILIAPNFSLGAVMMMKVAEELAPYFPDVEIIELHHNHKYDAPSGTSKLTAEKIDKARKLAGVTPEADLTKESLTGARGASLCEIPIHSVRLPGYVAHQEILFGGYMETFSVRHDSFNRVSFMPGVVLACKKVVEHPGLTYGLEHYL